MTLYKWSKTANNNATADSTINWAEGQAPSSVNNSSRAEMAAIAKYRDDVSGMLNSTGSADAYALTTNQVLTTLTDGYKITFRCNATNTGSSTINVDTLGAKQLRAYEGTTLYAGALIEGSIYSATYDSGDDIWLLHSPTPNALPVTNLAITSATALTAPAVDDELPIYDLDATANKKITLANTLKAINGLTEDTAPDADADFVATYDASASGAKKVLSYRLGAFGGQLLHVRDEKSASTNGGTFTSGAWRTRTLNTTKTNEISGASLATNQITLPAGTYFIDARAPAAGGEQDHVAKLANITDTEDTVIGSAHHGTVGDATARTTGHSFVKGRFTIAGETVFELQHITSATVNTDGLGVAVNLGVIEVYAEVLIWKVA